MDQLIRTNLLNQFVDHWNSWTYAEKPHSFWIREYDLGEVTLKTFFPNLIWVKNAWLLDENGLHERNPLDWRRFEMLRDFPYRSASKSTSGAIHEIGTGWFVPLNKSEFLFEEIWGPRWGNRSVFTMDEAGNVLSRSLKRMY